MIYFKQLLLLTLVLFGSRSASAEMLQFTFDFKATGGIGGTNFTDAQVRVLGVGNTDNREMFDLGGGYWIFHNGATIEIEGLGTYDFLGPTRTFVFTLHGSIGFSGVGGDVFDLFAGGQVATGWIPEGYTWECLTEVGPIKSDAWCDRWMTTPVPTSGGVLKLQPNTMRITFESDAIPGPIAGTDYCFGDATGIPCPCFAYGNTGEGCGNSTGAGARLIGAGNPFLSADTFRLDVMGLPNGVPCMLLRGNNSIAVPAGAGILCTTGRVMRSQVQLASGGTASFTDFNGSPIGASSNGWGVPTRYQSWYRDAPPAQCPGVSFNLSNGWVVSYLP